MNLAALERMVLQGDLSRDAFSYLLSCRGECEWLDYKEALDLETDPALCGFARDVLAMKNVGGGYLLIGVRDKTWEQVGLPKRLPYDTKLLRDKVLRATGLQLDVDIVHHDLVADGASLPFALILTRASRKRNKRRSPSVVAKDFCHNLPYGLRRGDIWIRRGDSTIRVTTQAELEEILDRLEDEADRNALEGPQQASPFAVANGTYRLLDRGFDTFVGRMELRDKLLRAILQDPRLWIINVHGPGGVGKSALVNWATYELYRRRDFEAILQLTAKETVLTEAGIRAHGRSLYSLENLIDHILGLFEESTEGDLETKKALATELLSAWKTLLVLDNMETVSDGRVLSFIQDLPPSNKSKVVLTSRQKTGAWELPIPVSELSPLEVREFIHAKAADLGIPFPLDELTAERTAEVSGGLPLAIQWIIGQYRLTKRLDVALARAKEKDSPVLEFSFRNIWNLLSPVAKTTLSSMSIFDGPVTVQQLGIATEMSIDALEQALTELSEVTLVTRGTQQSDGRVLFSALPITLEFARHQLAQMGDLEVRARKRVNCFSQQMELQHHEIARFKSIFDQYGLDSDNERRAAILCRRAESEVFAGKVHEAEALFRQAKDLAPQSAYVLAMTASYELTQKRIGAAKSRITEAVRRTTRRTGALVHTIRARICDEERDRGGTVDAFADAISFDPDDNVLRHQYGVALSRSGRTEEAIAQFTQIIEAESHRSPPRETMVMALTTRIINLKRLGRTSAAAEDVRAARELLTHYPHLESVGRRLRELIDEGTEESVQ